MKHTDAFARYSRLPTEQNNPRTRDLDRVPLRRVLEKLNHEDVLVPKAVAKAIPRIEKAARAISRSYLAGNKIYFIGAGTSGRLGVLEAAEIPPTYGVGSGVFTALMAGGKDAVFLSKEGAEDVFENGRKEISRLVRRGDTVVGIAASGITPYVQGGLAAGRKAGAVTVLVTCNPREKAKEASIRVALDVGPEPVSGSTRMKSATAQKMILNMISTAIMIRLGRVESNLLVNMQTRCHKLRDRAIRVVMELTGASADESDAALEAMGGNVREAIEEVRSGA